MIALPHEVLGMLLDALGLANQQVKRVVLVFDADDVARLHVEHYLVEEQADAIADWVRANGPILAASGKVIIDQTGQAWTQGHEYALLRDLVRRVRNLAAQETASAGAGYVGPWATLGSILAMIDQFEEQQPVVAPGEQSST